MRKSFTSNAQWPTGTLGFDNDISTDDHDSYEAAESVCKLLRRNGFGGERKIFPVRTWVTEKEQTPLHEIEKQGWPHYLAE